MNLTSRVMHISLVDHFHNLLFLNCKEPSCIVHPSSGNSLIVFCHWFNYNKNIVLLKKAGPLLVQLWCQHKRTMLVNNRFHVLHTVYNSWQPMMTWWSAGLTSAVVWHWSWTGDRINICTYFVSETRISPQGSIWGWILMQQQNHWCHLPTSVPQLL